MHDARVGLMLYTVRRACARDFEGTLRAVAALEFGGVEIFIVPAAAQRAEWLLVEQDETEDGDELAAATLSLKAVTSMLERAA